MKKLAIFDLDYTITKKETLMEFFRYNIRINKKNIIYLPRALFCGLMYGVRIYDEKKVKEVFLKFLCGINKQQLKELTEKFYDEVLKNILYKDALNMIRDLKNKGFDVYIISASPEFYIKEFYKIKEVDKIIGTRFLFENDIFTGKMEGNNCKGIEKVKRLKEFIKKENIEIDFKQSYMFSDSLSDKPLLDLVGKPHLINYRKKNLIQILNWE